MRGRIVLFVTVWAAACGHSVGEPVEVGVPAGATFSIVTDTLASRGIVRWPTLFRVYARMRGDDERVKAGRYALAPGERWSRILDDLTTGRVVTVPLTIPEGFRLPQIAQRVAALTRLAPDSVIAALEAPGVDSVFGVPGPGLEGYLFPDTYRFAEGVSLDTVIAAMTRRYRQAWTPERRALRDATGLTERDAITLASIVQAEARKPEEMPRIASVYLNRLRARHAPPGRSDRALRAGRPARSPPVRGHRLGSRQPLQHVHAAGAPARPHRGARGGGDRRRAGSFGRVVPVLRGLAGRHAIIFSRTLAEHNRAVAQATKGAGTSERQRVRRPDSGDGTDRLRSALRLLVVTDRRLAAPEKPSTAVVGAALSGGARAVQLRNKGDSARELLAVGADLRALTRAAGALLFVNDRLDVALALEADGVHLGPDDLPVAAARAVAPAAVPHRPLGGRPRGGAPGRGRRRRLHRVRDGLRHDHEAGRRRRHRLGGLGAWSGRWPYRCWRIGGITIERAGEVAATGAAGIAVVGAVMSAPDPAAAVRASARRRVERAGVSRSARQVRDT